MKYVWEGHVADSEIRNESARQAALNSWTAADKRWKKRRFLDCQSSPQSNAFRFASGTPEHWLPLMGPRDSRATGKKSWARQSELYFVGLPNSCSLSIFHTT